MTEFYTILELAINSKEYEALKEIARVTTRLKSGLLGDEASEGLRLLSQHSDIPNAILISALRNTYSFRCIIPFWCEFFKFVDNTLRERGADTKVALRGLIS